MESATELTLTMIRNTSSRIWCLRSVRMILPIHFVVSWKGEKWPAMLRVLLLAPRTWESPHPGHLRYPNQRQFLILKMPFILLLVSPSSRDHFATYIMLLPNTIQVLYPCTMNILRRGGLDTTKHFHVSISVILTFHPIDLAPQISDSASRIDFCKKYTNYIAESSCHSPSYIAVARIHIFVVAYSDTITAISQQPLVQTGS